MRADRMQPIYRGGGRQFGMAGGGFVRTNTTMHEQHGVLDRQCKDAKEEGGGKEGEKKKNHIATTYFDRGSGGRGWPEVRR